MDGFRRMLWIGRQRSADHIPVSALQSKTMDGFRRMLAGVLAFGGDVPLADHIPVSALQSKTMDGFRRMLGVCSHLANMSRFGGSHPCIRPTCLEDAMPDYRRYRVPGGIYFFTVNLLERRLDTLVRHIDALREAVRVTRRERPFHIDAWVVLPDHLHCI